MKEFLSNAWVVSIASGIVVFIITNSFMIFQDKKHNKKQLFEANTMALNHLRSYVVANELPQPEIIEALKHSIAREYNVKYEELLTTKAVCEDLVKDILGNNYISNDDQKEYIIMLQNYMHDLNAVDKENESINENIPSRSSYKMKLYMSLFSGFSTSVAGLIMAYFNLNYTINSTTLAIAISIIILIIVVFSLTKVYFRNYRKK